jgi:hypothetical protein
MPVDERMQDRAEPGRETSQGLSRPTVALINHEHDGVDFTSLGKPGPESKPNDLVLGEPVEH